jgi:hypothetical protein
MKAKQVRWFHPDGGSMPNGVFFQRGGWLAACAANSQRFEPFDAGVAVFPSGTRIDGAGRAFSGRYVSESGTRYGADSPTLPVPGLTGKAFAKRAAELAEAHGQPEILAREPFGREIWVVSVPRKERPAEEEWTVRNLSDAKGAYNGSRWWAARFAKKLAERCFDRLVAFPGGTAGVPAACRRKRLEKACARLAENGAFGRVDCHVWEGFGVETGYRGLGENSPSVEVSRLPKERIVDFAKALCAEAGESRAVVWEGVDAFQPLDGAGEWEGDPGTVWWLEKREEPAKAEEDPAERAATVREVVAEHGKLHESGIRRAGKLVVARVRVEDWFAPEGVFREAWMAVSRKMGWSGSLFALRWARKGGGEEVVERALVTGGVPREELEKLVDSVPGTVCREVQVAREERGDGRWLDELFGARPEGVDEGEWVLAEAGYLEPPKPSVFSRHERYFPLRERNPPEAAGKESPESVASIPSKIRCFALLQWMGPKTWADKAEQKRFPDRIEKTLRDGHFAWFRVGTGEGIPSSRCWMVFNSSGDWNYWKDYGVTRILSVTADGVRGYWSGGGKQWWRVESCDVAGKGVQMENPAAAYRAACGEMPWDVPFFDGSEKNLARLAKMYACVTGAMVRGGRSEAEVDRLLERTKASAGFANWAACGELYGGRFRWEKGEEW